MVVTMTISMTISMVVVAPVARAAFLYVPPEEPAAIAVESVSPEESVPVPEQEPGQEHDAMPVGSTVEAVIENFDPEFWRVRSGETLRGVLSRWGARGGVEVLFLTDRRYRLHETRVFEGSFAAATHSLFASLNHLPHAPVGEPRPDGRTLAVMHRAHPVGGGQ